MGKTVKLTPPLNDPEAGHRNTDQASSNLKNLLKNPNNPAKKSTYYARYNIQ